MTHLALVNPLLFEPGERLTLDEFLQRWEQMPGLKFAELIDGLVHTPSRVSLEHSQRDGHIHAPMVFYAARTGVCELLPNPTLLVAGSAPQPDAVLRLVPAYGGSTRPAGKFIAGVPDLVIEICGSSRSFDLGPKMALYQRAGIPEYLTILLEERRIECRRLERGSYRVYQPDDDGILRSRVFPGLWVDEHAFWAGDTNRLLDVVSTGIQSDECKAFLARLTGR